MVCKCIITCIANVSIQFANVSIPLKHHVCIIHSIALCVYGPQVMFARLVVWSTLWYFYCTI